MEQIPVSKNDRTFQMIKKRKRILPSTASSSEDQDLEESKSVIDEQWKRQIHSKIEKRRRDKMNDYISQLSAMIPTYNSSSQKLDKITVLRLTLQYLRSIRNSPMLTAEENPKYTYFTDEEMKRLIVEQVSEGFVFVMGCDDAKILFVSQSVSKTLNCNSTDLLGRSLYDYIHPYDIDKIKEQLSHVDSNSGHQTMTSKSKDLELKIPSEQLGLHPGERRSFFFRIKSHIEEKSKNSLQTNEYSRPNFKNTGIIGTGTELDSVNNNGVPLEQNQYVTIQCTGYLKYWNSIDKTDITVTDKDVSSLMCLVSVGRKIDNVLSSIREIDQPYVFVSKHSVDGKFLFVDNWITSSTGYLPQEVFGTSIYDYIHPEDVNRFAVTHQSMLQYPNTTIIDTNFRFRTKCGIFVAVQSEWKTLVNPWKKEIEYFYSKNTVQWFKDVNYIDKEKQEQDINQNDLFEYSNFPTEKSENNLVLDFNFQDAICEKTANDASMEAILKLLECDTNMVH